MIKLLIKRTRDILQKENLLIYQMGKVGSTSIENSLHQSEMNIEHIHSFYSPITYEMFNGFASTRYYNNFRNRIRYKVVNQLVKKNLLKSKRELKIITLAREPISRNISMFFQDLHIPIFELTKLLGRSEKQEVIEQLNKYFLENFNHEYGVNWFDNEIKKTFNINIYDYGFDKELGYSIIEKENTKILLLKMEKLSNLEHVIAEYLNMSDFTLKNSNRSSNKWYSDLYKSFKSDFKPTKAYVDKLYNSKYMSYFYTKEEIESYYKKWIH